VCGYHRSMIYMNVSHALAGVAVLADMLLTTHFMTLVLLTLEAAAVGLRAVLHRICSH